MPSTRAGKHPLCHCRWVCVALHGAPRGTIDLDLFITLKEEFAKKKSKLISMKVPLNLLIAFKHKAKMKGRPYQSIIKSLMQELVIED